MTTSTTKKCTPKPVREEERDQTYLAEKDPTDLHEDMSAWIQEVVGLDLDAEQAELFTKAVQATAVLRIAYQRSDRNKARSGYRALPAEVVAKRAEHMTQAAVEAKAEIEARKATEKPKPAAKKAAASRARNATATKRS